MLPAINELILPLNSNSLTPSYNAKNFYEAGLKAKKILTHLIRAHQIYGEAATSDIL